MKHLALLLCMVLVPDAVAGQQRPTPTSSSFEAMKQLVGRWEGTTDNGATDAVVVYRLTGRGTSLVETLLPGTPQEMMTIYHDNADGDLVGTHYCSAGNQPAIRLVRAEEGHFFFEHAPDDRNVDEASELHGHQLGVTLKGARELELEWFNWDEGAPIGSRRYVFTRVD